MDLRRYRWILPTALIAAGAFSSLGCSSLIKQQDKGRPVLLKTESAAIEKLLSEVDRYASVTSMRAKMDLKFEDNSFAEMGIAEKYRTADAEIVLKRPSKILLKIQAPLAITSIDIAQMTSDGERFRVAILEDGGSGKNRKFILGTNAADYSPLQENVQTLGEGVDKELLKKVSAFANIRPQHFTEAVLMRPVDRSAYVYSQSAIFQEEDDLIERGKSATRRVMRGYYLLDELSQADGAVRVVRRFWFDRVGSMRLARQQIFDRAGEIETDIVYGAEGKLTAAEGYDRMPLMIELTRPKERYRIRVSYQAPELVVVGPNFKDEIFVLQNEKNLPVVDLDEKLRELRSRKP